MRIEVSTKASSDYPVDCAWLRTCLAKDLKDLARDTGNDQDSDHQVTQTHGSTSMPMQPVDPPYQLTRGQMDQTLERSPTGSGLAVGCKRIVGSIVELLHAGDDPVMAMDLELRCRE